MSHRLASRRVLVTGGSEGIGLAIAKACADEGATVIVTGRNESKLAAALASLGDRAKGFAWDVSCVHECDAKLTEAERLAGGPLNALVNNAGALTKLRFPDVTEAWWDYVQDTHAKGAFFLTQAIVKRWLATRQAGHILNMASVRSFIGVDDGPYGMAKWGLVGLTKGLGLKLAPYNIRVNAIAPGLIDTPGLRAIFPKCEKAAKEGYMPIRRLGRPEEVAAIAVFLLTNDLIAGETIVCDGGMSLKANVEGLKLKV